MISIAIPTLNEEKHIGALLESLIDQEVDEEVEVVIADSGSIDRTKEIAESYKKHFFRLIIVEGGTPAIGRNRAARASKGDPIFFLDADVLLPSRSFLQVSVSHFRNQQLVVAAAPLIPRSRKKIDHFLGNFSTAFLHLSKYIQPAGAMCIMTKRSTFESTGGYPEDVYMNEDHDFVRYCSREGAYGVLPLPVSFSVRRMEKEGRLGLALKYIAITTYRTFRGPVRKQIVPYEFAYTEKEDTA